MNYTYLERLVNSKKSIITHFLFPLILTELIHIFFLLITRKKRILQRSKENIHLIRTMAKEMRVTSPYK